MSNVRTLTLNSFRTGKALKQISSFFLLICGSFLRFSLFGVTDLSIEMIALFCDFSSALRKLNVYISTK